MIKIIYLKSHECVNIIIGGIYMEIFIRGENIKITDAISNYTKEKVGKLERYIGESENVKATVQFNVRNHNQKVEITIPLKNVILRAEETKDDLYTAIDLVIEKIERQIRKNKTKLQSKRFKNTVSKDFILNEIIEDLNDEEEKIVKRKKIELKPMDEEEAIVQMELLGHQFFIFKRADGEGVSVVYKRKEGNYGIIDSE